VRPLNPSRHDAPLLYAALAFAAGIVISRYVWRGPLWWCAAVFVFALAASYYAHRRTRLGIAIVLSAFVTAGGIVATARQFHRPSPDLTYLNGREVMLTAHVVRESPEAKNGSESSQSIDLETESLAAGPPPALRKPFQRLVFGPFGTAAPLQITVRATVYGHEDEDGEEEGAAEAPAFPPLLYGERVRVVGRLRVPRNFGNPGAFDYRQYLAEHGISALISVRADRLERLPGFHGSRAGLWRSRIRNALLQRIHALWSEKDAALLSAMLVSERSGIARDARTDFQRSGTYHLLVVAGLHLGILAWFCFALLRRLRLNEIAASVATVAFACSYAWVADDGIPIWRATLMLTLYLIARLLYRPHAALNAIGGAALVLLTADPVSIFSASFQLSFAAVLAIVAIAAPLLERTSGPYLHGLRQIGSTSLDLHLPPRIAQFRIDLRMISSRLAPITGTRIAIFMVVRTAWGTLRIFELVVLSAIMQVALALPMAWYFHRATTLSVAANLFAVPLAGILLPAALIALACSFVAPLLAFIPAFVASATLHAISSTTILFGHAIDLRVPAPRASVAIACIAAFVIAAVAVRSRRIVAAASLALFVFTATLPVLAPPPVQRRAGVLEVTAIDVGQGDALLVISPEGHTLLIDSGGQLGPTHSEFDFGEDIISPYLWSRGIRSLDAVALTHAHQDHIGGMRGVIANFHPRQLWLGAEPHILAISSVIAQAIAHGAVVRHFASPDQFTFGSAQVSVLAPLPGYTPGLRASNNDSLVLEISYGSTRALLAGDIEKKVERELAGSPPETQPGMYADLLPLLSRSNGAQPGESAGAKSQRSAVAQRDIHADLLKIAHHGSATSTTSEFLTAVHPQFAVISAGFQNSFGHPRPEVLTRLEQSHVATYRTDTIGAVTFYLDGKRVVVAINRSAQP
jgi:competence protein ComEC